MLQFTIQCIFLWPHGLACVHPYALLIFSVFSWGERASCKQVTVSLLMMFFSNTVASLLIQLIISDKNVTSQRGERVEFAVRFCSILKFSVRLHESRSPRQNLPGRSSRTIQSEGYKFFLTSVYSEMRNNWSGVDPKFCRLPRFVWSHLCVCWVESKKYLTWTGVVFFWVSLS